MRPAVQTSRVRGVNVATLERWLHSAGCTKGAFGDDPKKVFFWGATVTGADTESAAVPARGVPHVEGAAEREPTLLLLPPPPPPPPPPRVRLSRAFRFAWCSSNGGQGQGINARRHHITVRASWLVHLNNAVRLGGKTANSLAPFACGQPWPAGWQSSFRIETPWRRNQSG